MADGLLLMNAANTTQDGPLPFSGGTQTSRNNQLLGGVDKVVDETGEKVREEFLNFLET